jgi:hypothetical protein
MTFISKHQGATESLDLCFSESVFSTLVQCVATLSTKERSIVFQVFVTYFIDSIITI